MAVEQAIDGWQQTLAETGTFGYETRYYAGQTFGSVPEYYVEVTARIASCTVWYGRRSDHIYGWQAKIKGHDWDSELFKPGNVFKATRRFRVAGEWDYTEAQDWPTVFEGVIMPGTVDIDYSGSQCQLEVVDVLQYLGRAQSPIIVVGKRNLASGAAVSADSANLAQNLVDDNEFTGEPDLGPERAIDASMDTLWVSQKAPTRTTVESAFPNDPKMLNTNIVNEAFVEPHAAFGKKENQWFELVRNGPASGEYDLSLCTRFGVVGFDKLRYSLPYQDDEDPPAGNNAAFAIVCYDLKNYEALWGQAANVPVYQWREYRSAGYFGQVQGNEWGFNLDGQGDYIAVNDDWKRGRSDHRWRTCLVIDGPKTQRADSGTFAAFQAEYADINTGETWDAGELEGCYITRTTGGDHRNCTHYIANNDATDAGVTRIYFHDDDPWEDYDDNVEGTPEAGDSYQLRGYPWHNYTNEFPYGWSGGNVTNPDPGSSVRKSKDGGFAIVDGDYANDWVEDDSPAPGLSGVYNDADGWAWIMVSPDEMEILTTGLLEEGDGTIHVNGTDGLLDAGYVYLGGQVVEYSSKTAATIALSSAWGVGYGQQPIGTRVYQYEDGAATAVWPIYEVRARRRLIPIPDIYQARFRVIKDARVFGSTFTNPRTPGDADWRLDWLGTAALWQVNGNETQTDLRWNVSQVPSAERTYLRLKHVLLAIRQMSDDSYGRLNELELYPPGAMIDGLLTSESTIADLFRYLLELMGLETGQIQADNASQYPISEVSTDGSSYLAVLEDLARRTGQVVWAGPHSFIVRVVFAPDWPGYEAGENQFNFTTANLRGVSLTGYDDYTVSQVQAGVRDAAGEVAMGRYPPVARALGQIELVDEIYHAELVYKDSIARTLFARLIQDQVTAVTAGPCPWARPLQRVTLTWAIDETRWSNRTFVIDGLEHTIDHGTTRSGSRTWITELTLRSIPNLP